MKVRFLALALSLFLPVFSAEAACVAGSKAGDGCLQEGETCMTTGRESILACLRQTSAVDDPSVPLVWKTTTGGGNAPAGAVMAFNLDKCPDDWTEIVMPGMTIVGAGSATDAYGTATFTRGLPGGERMHVLTTAEMPAHSHPVRIGITGGVVVFEISNGLSRERNNWVNGANSYQSLTSGGQPFIQPIGSGQAHNNMPPYLPMLYCQKN